MFVENPVKVLKFLPVSFLMKFIDLQTMLDLLQSNNGFYIIFLFPFCPTRALQFGGELSRNVYTWRNIACIVLSEMKLNYR